MGQLNQFLDSVDTLSAVFFITFLIPVCFLIVTIVKAVISPLRYLPGPTLARFSRLWYLSKVWKGDFEKTNLELHRKYGPIVRIAPNEYSIDDFESVKIIYGHGKPFIKAPWYYASGNPDPDVTNIFTDRNPKRHAETRRKFAALYSMTTLVQLEPYVTECTDLLIAKFEDFARSRQSINLQHWLQYYAFDLIGLMTLAKRFGFLNEGLDQGGLLEALHGYLVYCANVGVYSEWHPLVSKLVKLLPGTGFAYLTTFTQEQIQSRLAQPDSEKITRVGGGDFLTKLLQMHGDQPDYITMETVFTGCITNIGAGSDTTSVSLSGILYHLIQNPKALAKLRSEIDSQAAQNKLSNPITYQESQTMPYLQACIKEGLRLHPATGLPLARVVPPGGATLAGTFFPEGTIVGINTWVAHQNKSVFGNDAAFFRPERWLEATSETAGAMERYFLTFGAGSRTCIGKNISLLEISKLVPELVRRFDFELVHPAEPLQTLNVWFVKQLNLHCRVSLRSS